MSGTECYSSSFFIAWHSSSQQGRGIMHCIPLKTWWCKFEECSLPRLELTDHLHEELLFFSLHPCLTAFLSQSLLPLCCGGRRLIAEMLWGVGRAAPEAAGSAVSAWIQLFSAHGHCSYCITSLHGATEEYMLKLTLKCASPQKILRSVSKLAVQMETCPWIWPQKAEVILLDITGQGLMW